MQNSIAAVVVTFNRIELLKNCIESLRLQTKRPDGIIVVNNGSTDQTTDWLNSQNDLIVVNQQNLGSSGGFNRGVKEGVSRGFGFLWLMDDDVIPSDTALEKLLEIKQKGIEFSYLSSLVIGKNGDKINVPPISLEINAKTGYADWACCFEHSIVKTKQSTFVSILIDSEIVKLVGLPIKEFFIWGDDYEYTLRLSSIKPGFFVSNSIVKHLREIEKTPSLYTETNRNRIKFHYYAIRNNMYQTMKNNSKTKGMYKCLKETFALVKGCIYNPSFFFKFKIILKATIHGFLFHPEVEYL